MSVPNSVIDGEGFFVSHNDRDTGIYGGVTTALVQGQMERFYILRGDHRQAYAALIASGFDACMAYFKSLPHLHHPMGDPLPA